MKKIAVVFVLIMLACANVSAKALSADEKKACEKLLVAANEKQMDWVYETCGFDDEDLAWFEWAPMMSLAENKKALFELCRRHPTHDYAPLYCQKSADLGYAPAYYQMAKNAYLNDENGLYETYLKRVIELNSLENKKRLLDESDYTARQAYEDLAKLYLKSADVQKREEGLTYLQIAADAGSAEAAHSLGILLFPNPAQDQQALSEKYLWKAILMGCPAAEESLGLMNYQRQGRLMPKDVKEELDTRLYTCVPSKSTKSTKPILTVDDCNCTQVMSWYESQGNKPFVIDKIDNGTALLKDSDGREYQVQKGDKVGDGFVVLEVRPTAVIIRRVNERHVLLYRDDIACVELCVNPTIIPKRYVKDLPPYQLTFTDEECSKLAQGIEDLTNPLAPFRGLPECQLQDWQRWGEGALAEKRNKHLFLMANYDETEYAPADVARATLMMKTDMDKYLSEIHKALYDATAKLVIDELSAIKHEQAHCLQTKLFMDLGDFEQAYYWAKLGADENLPHSLNMLGVLYATGNGVEQDTQQASELFKKADAAAYYPFIDARQNYKIVQDGKDVSGFIYGQCEQIVQPKPVQINELLEVY